MSSVKLNFAVSHYPSVTDYLPLRQRLIARKSAPTSRDVLERVLARAIRKVENTFFAEMENGGGKIDADFWQRYYDALRVAIAEPIRAQVETGLSNYSDLASIIDSNDAAARIEANVTNTINSVAQSVTDKTKRTYEALLLAGIVGDELLSRLAVRFSEGHAEQIAVTELTRAESLFADELSARLNEQGLKTQIRWLTAEDEKVCPVCAPADHKLKDQPITSSRGGWNGQSWGERLQRPPAHPHCRCQTVVELAK